MEMERFKYRAGEEDFGAAALALDLVPSEWPIALMPTLIRWWEALRAPDVAKWQQKYRVDWTSRMVELEEPSKRCGKY